MTHANPKRAPSKHVATKNQRKYETLADLTPFVNDCKCQRLLGEVSIRKIVTNNCYVH